MDHVEDLTETIERDIVSMSNVRAELEHMRRVVLNVKNADWPVWLKVRTVSIIMYENNFNSLACAGRDRNRNIMMFSDVAAFLRIVLLVLFHIHMYILSVHPLFFNKCATLQIYPAPYDPHRAKALPGSPHRLFIFHSRSRTRRPPLAISFNASLIVLSISV
jgi:hypothetical protein